MAIQRIYSNGNLNCKAWVGRAEDAQQMAKMVQDKIEREKSEKSIRKIEETLALIDRKNKEKLTQ